jgi:hypothetical protein
MHFGTGCLASNALVSGKLVDIVDDFFCREGRKVVKTKPLVMEVLRKALNSCHIEYRLGD